MNDFSVIPCLRDCFFFIFYLFFLLFRIKACDTFHFNFAILIVPLTMDRCNQHCANTCRMSFDNSVSILHFRIVVAAHWTLVNWTIAWLHCLAKLCGWHRTSSQFDCAKIQLSSQNIWNGFQLNRKFIFHRKKSNRPNEMIIYCNLYFELKVSR